MTVDEILRGAAADLVEDVRAAVDAPAALDRIEQSRPPRRRRLPALAAAVVLIALATAAIVVATTGSDGEPVTSGAPTTSPVIVRGPNPGESVGLEMTADPDTDLVAGDRVRVTADGLPGSDVALALCRADALDVGAPDLGAERCDLELSGESRIDPDGRMDASVVVKRQLVLGDGSALDCAAQGVRCAIGVVLETPIGEPRGPGVGTAIRRELLGLVGVAFTPTEADPAPVLTVDPADGLRHGQTVTVEGVGFRGSVGHADLCEVEGGPCTMVPLGRSMGAELRTDDEGRFQVDIPVWRVFPANIGAGDATTVDCADRGCTLIVRDDVGQQSAPVEVSFDEGVSPPEPPNLALEPVTGVRAGDAITVTVRGLSTGDEVMVLACSPRPEAPGRVCGQSTEIGTVVGDDHGVGTTTVTAPDPTAYGVDCTAPATCAIALMPLRDGAADPMISATRPVPVQYAP